MFEIKSLKAEEILDSRGNPTIEVKCILSGGAEGVASVPSGASTGSHEACELRDGDIERYKGLGVLKAVSNVKDSIAKALNNRQFDQQKLDEFLIELDGTVNKSSLGANAILGVSLAFARACSADKKMELYNHVANLSENDSPSLPVPMLNIINGGKHADSGLDIQEFMIAPVGVEKFREKIRASEEIITSLKKILVLNGYPISVGDEGGFAPKLNSNEEALDLIVEAIDESGYNGKVKIAIDAASSSFYKEGKYVLKIDGVDKSLNNYELLNWYNELVKKYPIISIEDGFAEDDWEGFQNMKKLFEGKVTIVGDDLTVTNVARIGEAVQKNAISSVIIKPNQIGTLTETLAAIRICKDNSIVPFVSHRSGETTDTFIADLAVGVSSGYIKSGSLTRGERVCKYNRLSEIADLLDA